MGPSINDVSSKGEGVKIVGIYLVKRRQRGREGGVIKLEKWADVVYGCPLSKNYATFLTNYVHI